MAADPVFWQSLKNNLLFALGTIPTSIALALAMALLVNGKLRGRAFLRLSYFTPTILPMIAVANIWLFFFTPGYGLLEQVTGLFGLPTHNGLGGPATPLPSLIAGRFGKGAGFFLSFYLPGLKSTRPGLAGAAWFEGRGAWYFFGGLTS